MLQRSLIGFAFACGVPCSGPSSQAFCSFLFKWVTVILAAVVSGNGERVSSYLIKAARSGSVAAV